MSAREAYLARQRERGVPSPERGADHILAGRIPVDRLCDSRARALALAMLIEAQPGWFAAKVAS